MKEREHPVTGSRLPVKSTDRSAGFSKRHQLTYESFVGRFGRYGEIGMVSRRGLQSERSLKGKPVPDA